MGNFETFYLVLEPHDRFLAREVVNNVVHYVHTRQSQDLYCEAKTTSAITLLERDRGDAVTCVRCLGLYR